jgi:hypothetical protein
MIKKSKSRKRIAIRRRGIASPETKMMRYEVLSGDVNWRTYGGKWY